MTMASHSEAVATARGIEQIKSVGSRRCVIVDKVGTPILENKFIVAKIL